MTLVRTYLRLRIAQTRNGDVAFFQAAHYWKFGRHAECSTDIKAYRDNETIPQYVIDFIGG